MTRCFFTRASLAEAEPANEPAEVVAGGGEHGVDGVAAHVGEVVAAHAVVVLEMADDRLDRRAPPELASDLLCDAPLLACGVNLNLCSGGALWPR